MTAVSFAINRGVDGFKMSDITVGTTAPGAGDIQLCFNVQDTNSHNLTDLDLVRALKAFIRWVETNGGTGIAITQQPSGPPE